ncbi:fungal hydrophobin [Mycena leptocephala]|nr:fungal hydrophobin [Mycena leptocephala]
MFSKLSVVVTSVLITFAAAIPTYPPPSSTGPQCCQSVESSSNTGVASLLGLLGVIVNGVNVPIGLNCSPITIAGNNCGGQTVNCNSAAAGGLINIGCVPITL